MAYFFQNAATGLVLWGIKDWGTLFILPIGVAGLFLLPFDMSLGFFGKIAFCSMIILGAASLGKRTPHIKLLKLLGDASYSIYLTHTIIPLYFLYKIWPKLPLEGWLQFIVWVISALLTSSIIGVLVYLYVEKPILNWLRNIWKRAATRRLPNSAMVINR